MPFEERAAVFENLDDFVVLIRHETTVGCLKVVTSFQLVEIFWKTSFQLVTTLVEFGWTTSWKLVTTPF